MKIGYGVSSWADTEDTRRAVKQELYDHGCIAVYLEVLAGRSQRRLELEKILHSLDERDVLIVNGLHDLGHNPEVVFTNFNRIHRAGASLRCLDVFLESSDPGGKSLLTVLAGLTREDKEALSERFDGVEKAYLSRRSTGAKRHGVLNLHRRRAALAVLTQGMSAADTARALGVSPVTIRRMWNEYLELERQGC